MKTNKFNTEEVQDVILPDIPTDEGNKKKLPNKKTLIISLATILCIIFSFLLVYSIVNNGRYNTETIGQTISEVKKISEFCTANYIGEVMIQDEEKKFLRHKKNSVDCSR